MFKIVKRFANDIETYSPSVNIYIIVFVHRTLLRVRNVLVANLSIFLYAKLDHTRDNGFRVESRKNRNLRYVTSGATSYRQTTLCVQLSAIFSLLLRRNGRNDDRRTRRSLDEPCDRKSEREELRAFEKLVPASRSRVRSLRISRGRATRKKTHPRCGNTNTLEPRRAINVPRGDARCICHTRARVHVRARARLSVFVRSLSPHRSCNTVRAPPLCARVSVPIRICDRRDYCRTRHFLLLSVVTCLSSNSIGSQDRPFFATPCRYSPSISIYSFFYSLHREIFFLRSVLSPP